MSVYLGQVIRDYNNKIAEVEAAQKAASAEEQKPIEENPDYPMLRLKKGKLEVVTRSETTGWQRFLKWVGVGSLSLKRISNYIHEHPEGLKTRDWKHEIKGAEEGSEPEDVELEDLAEEPLKQEEIENFAINLCNQYMTYNANRSINKVKFQNFEEISSLTGYSLAQLDNTYEKEDVVEKNQNNIDFSFAHALNEFAYVADTAGHNDERQLYRPAMSELYSNFNETYATALKKKKFKFKTLEEAKNFVKVQVNQLSNGLIALAKRDAAFSLAQVVNIDENLHLVTAQVADTLVVIKRGEEFILLNTHDSNAPGLMHMNSVEVKSTPIFLGDEMFIISDGIGKFITLEKFQEVILNNKIRSNLLKELRDTIVSDEWKEKVDEGGMEQLWGGTKLKKHDLGKKNGYDDLSLAYLRI